MIFNRRSLAVAAIALTTVFGPFAVTAASADPASRLTATGERALHKLERLEPRSIYFAKHAKAILVFPGILKAGFVFGAETGNGVLLVNGRADSFYNLSGGSWGLQIGGEDFGYVVFLMTESSLDYMKTNGGFSAGTGPSIVVVNKGAGGEVDTSTLTQDVYAFPFNQKGLMADLTLQGTKITRIHPD
jgi:lipid-binding SYLF domain-containing protein